MTSLLVTNDFPPKVGGIQSYLYELWRRLPPSETVVLAARGDGDAAFDAAQPFRILRRPEGWLLPTPTLRRAVDALAREIGAGVIFLDPMLPLGWIGPALRAAPYVVVVHGAEVTVPGRLPVTRPLARRVLRGAAGILAAGQYVRREAARVAGDDIRALVLAPGVDPERFRPLDAAARRAVRVRHGLDPDRLLVLGVSRLVPRKGFEVLIDAVARLAVDAQLAIAGGGRDRSRLLARSERRGVGAHFLGRVPDDELPGLYASADVFAMLCRDRWGGLEAEGYGIVFVEAAACGVPAVAGRSGGAAEAVRDGETGFVVDPLDPGAVAGALESLLLDDARRAAMGAAARARAVAELSYDALAARLAPLAAGDLDVLAR